VAGGLKKVIENTIGPDGNRFGAGSFNSCDNRGDLNVS